MSEWAKYKIEKFHSIPYLAEMFETDKASIIKAISLHGIMVMDRATYGGLGIATANGNRYGIKLEDHCTPIEDARYHPKVGNVTNDSSDEEIEKARQAFIGIPFVCEPPFTGCELIGVIKAYHETLERRLEEHGWKGIAKKEEPVGLSEGTVEAANQDGIIYDIPQHEIAKRCGVEPRTVLNWMKAGLLFEPQGKKKCFSLPLTNSILFSRCHESRANWSDC
ncbi:MAG: hypothetical protein PHR66_13805 [Desulfuromonadaceae bacterium]|nr:hypothetical protein [Desulfuromonadaceae bacterium]